MILLRGLYIAHFPDPVAVIPSLIVIRLSATFIIISYILPDVKLKFHILKNNFIGPQGIPAALIVMLFFLLAELPIIESQNIDASFPALQVLYLHRVSRLSDGQFIAQGRIRHKNDILTLVQDKLIKRP